jgi:hypothetical protein
MRRRRYEAEREAAPFGTFVTVKERLRIIVAPLDWGLGHATRSIPLVRSLLDLDCEVILASSGEALALLRREFPALPAETIASYGIRYGEKGLTPLAMFRQLPQLLRRIRAEQEDLKRLARTYRPHGVISDSRFGFRMRGLPSVILSHQLQLQVPAGLSAAGGAANALNRYFLGRFDECWVPDSAGSPLSGQLSRPRRDFRRMHYIGPLSRFSRPARATTPRYRLAVLISGPEPQRSLFEQNILHQLEGSAMEAAVVRGCPSENPGREVRGHVTVFPHLDADALQSLLLASSTVLSRAGYSSIMDYAALGSEAILVPTPGQTEQEYLAASLMERKIFYSETQDEFRLDRALGASAHYTIRHLEMEAPPGLREHMARWLQRLNAS